MKMVGVFKRSLSFPNKHHNRPSKPPPISHHIRSISLPCRSHPLISQLKDEITQLKTSWASKLDNRTSAWLCEGLSRLRDIHNSLDDILQLPQTQESLSRKHEWVEKILEDFLLFVDVYGIFQTLVLGFKEEQFAAQVALRKRDESKLALYIKARKKMVKEMGKLLSTVRCIGKYPLVPVPGSGSVVVSIGDAEIVGVVSDAVEVTVLVSMALFNGISSSFASSRKYSPWNAVKLSKKTNKVKVEEGIQEFQQVGAESLWGLRKKADEEVKIVLKRMQELERCIGAIEDGGEKVFKSLINSRVSFLNALTQ